MPDGSRITPLGSSPVSRQRSVMVNSLEEPPVSRSIFFRIIQALERSPSVSYILDAQQRFLYCNPAWDKFASSNGAPELTGETMVGFRLFDAIPDALKDFYSHAF